jgi:hypothetical protein
MTARFQHSQAFSPHGHAGDIAVPTLAHEFETVGWIGHDCIDAVVCERAHDFEAIADDNIPLLQDITF